MSRERFKSRADHRHQSTCHSWSETGTGGRDQTSTPCWAPPGRIGSLRRTRHGRAGQWWVKGQPRRPHCTGAGTGQSDIRNSQLHGPVLMRLVTILFVPNTSSPRTTRRVTVPGPGGPDEPRIEGICGKAPPVIAARATLLRLKNPGSGGDWSGPGRDRHLQHHLTHGPAAQHRVHRGPVFAQRKSMR